MKSICTVVGYFQSLIFTRAATAQTMTYLDSFRMLTQLKTVRAVTDFKDSCRISKLFQTVKMPLLELQTIKHMFVLVCSVRQLLSMKGDTKTMACHSGKGHSKNTNKKCILQWTHFIICQSMKTT